MTTTSGTAIPSGRDGSGGTDSGPPEASIICYGRGTLIGTKNGDVAIEDLAIGDKVITASGSKRPIKWIGRRSYRGAFIAGRKDILPVCIKADALDQNVPRRDLWVSPHHAMLLQGVLIEAQDLINGVSIVQAAHVDEIEYFHIELDCHDIIIAEGALSESFVDHDSRGLFHNADEYRTLYPDQAGTPAQYCAARRRDGREVEVTKRRIALRAGLLPDQQTESGTLRGAIDLVGVRRIGGWAQHAADPETPVAVDLYIGGRFRGRTLANRYREDLQRAGLGSGRHGFEFMLTAPVEDESVEIRRACDGAALKFREGQRPLRLRLG
jgi:Hint domain